MKEPKPRLTPEERQARKTAYRRTWMAARTPSPLKPPAPPREPKPDCIHWWLVPGDEAVPLRGITATRYPDAIGRRSVCKKCGETKTLPEHVWGGLNGSGWS